jgi:SPX domain protein involved in polyphosphate accumulation
MAIEIFNRYEKKYLIDYRTYEALQSRLQDCMDRDAYNRGGATYSICNVYYDTPDSHLIRTSLQKPVYKEKLRVRSYGVAQPDTKVFVEIKKKYNKLVNKRRSGITLSAAEQFLMTGEKPALTSKMNGQVIDEVAYMTSCKNLFPTLYLAYEREAWFGRGRHDLRISFDSHILTRRTDVSLSSPIYGEPLLAPGLRLMEIKVAQSIPVWLSRLLAEYKIYPNSFSKYGTEYAHRLMNYNGYEGYEGEQKYA